DALLTYEANRNSENGNENGNNNENGNESYDLGDGSRRSLHTARGCTYRRYYTPARVCTYKEFLNCQPLNFKGTEGAVGLAHWFEKMECVPYQAYTVGPSEKKEYDGTLPLCNKCKLHYNGPCTVKYANYKKVGHNDPGI
ncbi:hypothetical protein Tco_1222329, partial [Tanacetum coccineum]